MPVAHARKLTVCRAAGRPAEAAGSHLTRAEQDLAEAMSVSGGPSLSLPSRCRLRTRTLLLDVFQTRSRAITSAD
jgi:hypothetical protein